MVTVESSGDRSLYAGRAVGADSECHMSLITTNNETADRVLTADQRPRQAARVGRRPTKKITYLYL